MHEPKTETTKPGAQKISGVNLSRGFLQRQLCKRQLYRQKINC